MNTLIFGEDVKYTFSGRTAIDLILQDILINKRIKKVYFPSYCCDSMVEPFLIYGIDVKFYDVYYNNGLKYNINKQEKCDIFFAMNYFGYSSTNMEEYIYEFKKRGIIIIEDITHSIFSNKKYSKYSDYLIGSLRKWMPIISGGIAIKTRKNFSIKLRNVPENIITLKNNAMKLKKAYIENENKDLKLKEKYLKEFEKFNLFLNKNYKNYSIDKISYEILMKFNLEKMIKTRKENIKFIYNKLKNKNEIKFLIEKYSENDCLLFVPIILENNKRNKIRNMMIKKEVYLPIHWQTIQKISNSDISKRELSLICDQRYEKKDIKQYIDLIDKIL